jgi:hypothetical protein
VKTQPMRSPTQHSNRQGRSRESSLRSWDLTRNKIAPMAMEETFSHQGQTCAFPVQESEVRLSQKRPSPRVESAGADSWSAKHTIAGIPSEGRTGRLIAKSGHSYWRAGLLGIANY